MGSSTTIDHVMGARSNSTSRRKKRVVLFPCPYQGHINPMMQLATLLYTKGGFSITLIHTHFNSPNPSNYPHFNFEPISDGIDIVSRDTQVEHDIIGFLNALNVNCVEPFRACLLRLLTTSSSSTTTTTTLADEEKEENDGIIACIIADATMHFTKAVADSLRIPRLVLRTNSATSFLAFSAYPLLLQKGYLPIRDSELDKPVKELAPLKVKDLPMINTKNLETSYELIAQIVEKTRSSSGLILNSFEHLEQPSLDIIRRDFYPTPVFPIGPFHKWSSTMRPSSSSSSCSSNNGSSLLPEDHSCITWLDKQAPKSVIYVSFGSLADMHELELVETAWGLFNSGHPFLWVVRPGMVRGGQCDTRNNSSSSSCSSNGGCGGPTTAVAGRKGRLLLLPEKLVELEEMIIKSGRSWLVKWAPQQEVLVHPAVGAFWTHNGWNSTLESLCQGVPMLCRPCFGDQMVNARFVSDVWKVGFQFDVDNIDDDQNHHIGRSCTTPRLERGEVERAIKRLMDAVKLGVQQEDGEMMMKRVLELKEKADLSLKEGGSSFQSIQCLIQLISSF